MHPPDLNPWLVQIGAVSLFTPFGAPVTSTNLSIILPHNNRGRRVASLALLIRLVKYTNIIIIPPTYTNTITKNIQIAILSNSAQVTKFKKYF